MTRYEVELLKWTNPLRGTKAGSVAAEGAVFAYVHATDPEILLLLRADLKAEKPIWEFGAARMTMANCFLAKDEKVVWSLSSWQSREETYLTRIGVPWSALDD